MKSSRKGFRIFVLAITLFLCIGLNFASATSGTLTFPYSTSLSASAASSSLFQVRLLGIVDPDGGDRTSWQSSASSYLRNINNSSISRYTAFTASQFLTYLKFSDFFVVHTHGNQTELKAVASNGNISTVRLSDITSLSNSSLDDLDVAFIAACLCGKGGSSASNIINAIFQKGARCVIGYKDSVYTNANYIMIKSFCQAIGSGYTISAALAFGDTMVLSQYGSSGKTNDRLVRGDTSTSFVDRSVILGLTSDTVSDVIYLTDSAGDTVGFFDPSKLSATSDAPKVNVASEFPGNHAQSSIIYPFNQDKYALVENYYTADTGLWTKIYNYSINGIKTSDSVIFVQNSSGDIVSYMHNNAGAFDDISIDNIAVDAAISQLEQQLSSAEMSGYSIADIRLVIQNEAPAFRFSIQTSSTAEIQDYYVPLTGGSTL